MRGDYHLLSGQDGGTGQSERAILVFGDSILGPTRLDFQIPVAKFNTALQTMLPKADVKLTDFKQLDCDYVSQPTNALWYSVDAMQVLDEHGKAVFREKWDKRRDI